MLLNWIKLTLAGGGGRGGRGGGGGGLADDLITSENLIEI